MLGMLDLLRATKFGEMTVVVVGFPVTKTSKRECRCSLGVVVDTLQQRIMVSWIGLSRLFLP